MNLSILLFAGFVLGLKHALEADHVAAVSAIVSDGRGLKRPGLIGIIWGIGHTVSLLAAGIFVMLLKIRIPAQALLFFEFAVGVVLIILGMRILFKISAKQLHVHEHEHDGTRHAHLHSHETSASHRHAHRSFLVGMLHGLAGSGALMLLILPTAKTAPAGFIFILIFGLGSILGMSLVAMVLGHSLKMLARFDKIDKGLSVGAASLSIIIGLVTIFEIIK